MPAVLFPLKLWFGSSVVHLKDLKQSWVGSGKGLAEEQVGGKSPTARAGRFPQRR